MSTRIDLSTSGIITALVNAVISGSRKFKIFFTLNSILLLTGFGVKFLADYGVIFHELGAFGIILIGLSVAIFLGIYAYQTTIETQQAEAEIQTIKDRFNANPKEPTAAWELARIKLENYLNKNLSQVRWIFIWTVLIMIAGFIIIGYGIVNAYEPDAKIEAGLLTTASGIIVELIGATFLVIYKSTMSQAKEYVNVLERINAVGMSVQILDSIKDQDSNLQDQTRSELAKELLNLYAKKS